MSKVGVCAAAADVLLMPPPPVMTVRRAAAAAAVADSMDCMAASRRRHFHDELYSFLEFLTQLIISKSNVNTDSLRRCQAINKKYNTYKINQLRIGTIYDRFVKFRYIIY